MFGLFYLWVIKGSADSSRVQIVGNLDRASLPLSIIYLIALHYIDGVI